MFKRIILGVSLLTGLNSFAAADAAKEYMQRKKVIVNTEVIGFKQEKDFLFALHRVWTLKPSERRMQRIASNVVSDRIITNGCINVTDKVYDKLRQYFVLEVI